MKLRTINGLLVALMFAFGCGEAADLSCPASQCSDNGVCSLVGQRPSCECDEGFSGVTCSSCSEGFLRLADDSCAVSLACTTDTCNGQGTCIGGLNGPSCICDEGKGGPDCSLCAPGFHDEDGTCVLDQECLITSCFGRGDCTEVEGRVVCDCHLGFEGDACETELDPDTCPAVDPCGDHGTCDDSSGSAICQCDAGYLGTDCTLCYPGYTDDGTGNCVLTQICTASTCLGFGSCTTNLGVTSCDCGAVYDGAACEQCGPGYHRSGSGLECVVDQSCAAGDPCGANGTCDDSGGILTCICDDGYTGTLCNNCSPGYHPDGIGGCELNEICDALSCLNGASCDDATGEIVCTCASGFEGERCEINSDDCVHTACGTGTCIDLINDHVCLCLDSTYGISCP